MAGDPEDETLVHRAGNGDQTAWALLVRRYSRALWAVARQQGLGRDDAADVCQNTWLRLAAALPTLRRPDRVLSWLCTTARRESLRVLAARGRESLAPDGDLPVVTVDSPEAAVLRSERDCLLWRAFASLPQRCRRLLQLLADAPELSYAQLGRALGVSLNGLGPTRNRCLHALRGKLAAYGMVEEVGR